MMRVSRREFVGVLAAAAVVRPGFAAVRPAAGAYEVAARVDRVRVLKEADAALTQEPVTVTAAHSPRSTGGLHDYFSQSDYWWPDPKNPNGPYIRKDGLSNPDNFPNHRDAIIRLSVLAPALAAAWRLTRQKKYAAHFVKHVKAWFVDEATRMNPNLQYAQAVLNLSPGRGIGIIDTLQLVEVVRGLRVLEREGGMSAADAEAVRGWFAEYVTWMTTSKNGLEEKNEKNNHGTCWLLQVAEFSQFAKKPELTAMCRDRFKSFIVPGQIGKDGRLALELARTKPYSYSLFDCDVLSGVCQSLATREDDLWTYKTDACGSVVDAVGFMEPFIADKAKWPFAKDVEYFDDFPSRRPCLLFAGEAAGKPTWVTVWEGLDAEPTVEEVIRNLPIRQPVLWFDSGRV